MDLIATVEKIVLRAVSEEEAKNFALTNYGELCAYIRHEAVRKLLQQKAQALIMERRNNVLRECGWNIGKNSVRKMQKNAGKTATAFELLHSRAS